jgi:signal transduction histidine kinase
MASAFSFLARRRWAAVGLAVLVETALLVPLAVADPSSVVGLPAVVAAAIGGTVAVVFGPVDGAAVAFVGALVFGATAGWGAGELAALAAWPGIVAVAGLFARRVERQRVALTLLVSEQEAERRRLALELHDETAQMLAAALLSLGRVDGAPSAAEAGAASEATRDLIRQSIVRLRELAVELRPKALEDFGLGPAVERLAAEFSERTGIPVDVVADTRGRLPGELELAAYRAVEEVLAHVEEAGAGRVRLAISRAPRGLRLEADRHATDGARVPAPPADGLQGLRARVTLAGGRVAVRAARGRSTVRVDLPAPRA